MCGNSRDSQAGHVSHLSSRGPRVISDFQSTFAVEDTVMVSLAAASARTPRKKSGRSNLRIMAQFGVTNYRLGPQRLLSPPPGDSYRRSRRAVRRFCNRAKHRARRWMSMGGRSHKHSVCSIAETFSLTSSSRTAGALGSPHKRVWTRVGGPVRSCLGKRERQLAHIPYL